MKSKLRVWVNAIIIPVLLITYLVTIVTSVQANNFLTAPSQISTVNVTSSGNDWAVLSCSPATGATKYEYRWDTEGYPSDNTSGTLGYYGPSTTVNITGLPENEAVYFSIFPIAEVGEYTSHNSIGKHINILVNLLTQIDTIYYDTAQEDGVNPHLETAADELKLFWDDMSGGSLSITHEYPEAPAVYLSVNATMLAGYGDEAFRLESDTDGIRITGKTSLAVRHGTYSLLERLGVRWFLKGDDWTIVPDALPGLGTIDVVDEPDFFYRFFECPYNFTEGEDERQEWSMRNRVPGLIYIPQSHNYDNFCTWGDYGSEHPEYFVGNPPSSYQLDGYNEDVIDLAIAYWRDNIEGYISPRATADNLLYGGWDITPNDSATFAPDYNMSSETQNITDMVFHLVQEVADNISGDYPEKYVAVLSYREYAQTPSYNVTQNVLPFMVLGYRYVPETIYQTLDGLSSNNATVGIYFSLNVPAEGHDSVFMRLEKAYWLQRFAERGATAFHPESGDGWGGSAIFNYYINSRIMWDSTLDIDDILDDFYDKSFGNAAGTMKTYYETRDIDNASLQAGFNYLSTALSEANGDADSLTRIRIQICMLYDNWKWHNIGYENLSDDDLENFYTFIYKTRDYYLSHWYYAKEWLYAELIDRGYTNEETVALRDLTLPTAGEVSGYLSEAQSALSGNYTPYINPRTMDLTALGDTSTEELNPINARALTVLIPSTGNETIQVSVNGSGVIQMYDPWGLMIDQQTLAGSGSYVTYNFTVEDMGTYVAYLTYSEPTGTWGYVDVQNRSAAILADERLGRIFKPDDNPTHNAPNIPVGSYGTKLFFYVPEGTTDFWFGASCGGFTTKVRLTDPESTEYEWDYTSDTETQVTSPVAGLWKVEVGNTNRYEWFWVRGIPPLFWYDPEYLLVPVGE